MLGEGFDWATSDLSFGDKERFEVTTEPVSYSVDLGGGLN